MLRFIISIAIQFSIEQPRFRRITAFSRVKSKPVCSLRSPRLTSGCKLQVVRMKLSVCSRIPEAMKIPIMQRCPTDFYIASLSAVVIRKANVYDPENGTMERAAAITKQRESAQWKYYKMYEYPFSKNATSPWPVTLVKANFPHTPDFYNRDSFCERRVDVPHTHWRFLSWKHFESECFPNLGIPSGPVVHPFVWRIVSI